MRILLHSPSPWSCVETQIAKTVLLSQIMTIQVSKEKRRKKRIEHRKEATTCAYKSVGWSEWCQNLLEQFFFNTFLEHQRDYIYIYINTSTWEFCFDPRSSNCRSSGYDSESIFFIMSCIFYSTENCPSFHLVLFGYLILWYLEGRKTINLDMSIRKLYIETGRCIDVGLDRLSCPFFCAMKRIHSVCK